MLEPVDVNDEGPADRRTHSRIRIGRPCKVHDPRSGKYLPGSTRDLSVGGALIEIDRPLEIKPGDELFIGICQKRRQMFLRSDEMIRVRVLRSLMTPDGATVLAGEWLEEIVPLECLRRAA